MSYQESRSCPDGAWEGAERLLKPGAPSPCLYPRPEDAEQVSLVRNFILGALSGPRRVGRGTEREGVVRGDPWPPHRPPQTTGRSWGLGAIDLLQPGDRNWGGMGGEKSLEQGVILYVELEGLCPR